MTKDYLKKVKELVLHVLYKDFDYCAIKAYVVPLISSIVFVIEIEGYGHIFKAPFSLFESNLCTDALVNIIVDEVKEWSDKFDN